MDYDNNFNERLPEGKETEALFATKYIAHHMGRNNTTKADYRCRRKIIKDSDGDVYVTYYKELDDKNKPVVRLFEIKDDKKSNETGNLYIEAYSRGAPSGIITTEADYWAIKYYEMFFVIKTERLQKAIEDKRYYINSTHKDGIFKGGDYNSSLGFLFKIQMMQMLILEGQLDKDGSFTLYLT